MSITFSRKQWAIILVSGLVVVLAFISIVFREQALSLFKVHSHVIELRADGFHPSKLTITQGDTVVFSTNTGEPFWPASNVHPVHTAFPEFDPKEPVSPDATWSFTFNKPGTYRFHDHIASSFGGEIIVERKDGTRVTVDCSEQKNVQCWEKLMLETLEKEGVESALNTIMRLSETEPSFLNDCHGYSHLIGEKAYELYVTNENFELTPATALCGYGFYHGFMETLLLATGNIEEARAFCRYVDQKLSGQASAAATACFHGTGHGAIDGSDPTTWGNPQAMMEPGFRVCGLLAQTRLEAYLCETGVFNAIEILSYDPKYQIGFIADDPYDVLCNKQTLDRREACYSNMFPLILDKADNDIGKAADYINARMIDEDEAAIDGHTINGLVTLGLMFEYIRLHGEEEGYQERGIAFCRQQPEDDQLPCIEGLSGGHIKYGEPGIEYVKNLEFCENSMLTSVEKEHCYSYALPLMRTRYNSDTVEYICNQVAPVYKEKYCNQ